MRVLTLPSIQGHKVKRDKRKSAYTADELVMMKRVTEGVRTISPRKVAVCSRTTKNRIF